ncbi:Flp family type IVb pilin [Ornithinimicrobium murale]|uniref:Flp family type IVb pilin n=1 Tax=Ornithinimicrobium murale TaxID=1050153 RepID=UPI000E0D3E89|nr:Flp family type IVb pilin [Ornithinimicrobium murale]
MAALAYYVATLRAKFEDKEKGATAVEYGLLVALIAIVMIVGVTLVGDNLLALFNDVGAELELPAAT